MPQFRAANGNFYTRALFYETTLSDKSTVVYTLKEHDHEGYPSLYRLYLETMDPTEYQFAIKHLEGWTHWEEILSGKWFEEHISAWRKELQIKLRSTALANIIDFSRTKSKESFAANKYLADGLWVEKDQRRRGAPSKAEISKAAHEIATTNEQIEKDYERLMVQ